MNWRSHITQPIKMAIWDLDDTIWSETLSEHEDVRLYSNVKTTLAELSRRGIVNAICSKNHIAPAKRKLQDYGLWEYFVWASIDYTPKGPRIAKILNDIQISAENVLLIDDNAFELLEVLFYNKCINLLHAGLVDDLLSHPLVQGGCSNEIKQVNRIHQTNGMATLPISFESNEEFLKTLHIRIDFVDCKPEYLHSIHELVSRTNQLNYTKNRMSEKEINSMLADDHVTAMCIQETDDIGEKGFIGFFAIKDNTLIHFVFSCRILNMGIEQRVYSYLNYPVLSIVGEIAIPLSKNPVCDYIEVADPYNTLQKRDLLSGAYNETSQRTTIYAVGACDVFNMIGHLAAPCNQITIDCNTYKGNYRSINVGVEYIRSSCDMDRQEKEFCKAHLYNYTNESVFKPRMFDQEYDYVLLSSYDDFNYRIWVSKNDPNLRVLRSHEPVIGDDGGILTRDAGEAWLAEHFQPPHYIDEDRQYQNLQWVRSRLSPKTVLILLTGPEFNLYMLSNNPAERHNPELRARITKLNKTIQRFALDHQENVRVVDVNRFLTRIVHFTNNIFHWTPHKCYEIAKECLKTMCGDDMKKDYGFLHKLPVRDRKITLWGVNQYAHSCYYSLIANGVDIDVVCHHMPNHSEDFIVSPAETLDGMSRKYYVIVIDDENHETIEALLYQYGYTEHEDYVRLSSSVLLRTHTTVV